MGLETSRKHRDIDIDIAVKNGRREFKFSTSKQDLGRGIGISNETCIKSTQSCIKEKMPDSEFEEIKDKIISDCKSSGLSPERLALLEKLLNDEVFLTALNDFSIGNGCGTYSLLEVLNGYYNLNIN